MYIYVYMYIYIYIYIFTYIDLGRPLYAALVDTISSKILYRILLSETAAEPVHTLLVENHFIVTYWNTNAKRTELCSSALYEGMVDVFGLSPLSSFSAIPQQQVTYYVYICMYMYIYICIYIHIYLYLYLYE
jgi:hypothetical protein